MIRKSLDKSKKISKNLTSPGGQTPHEELGHMFLYEPISAVRPVCASIVSRSVLVPAAREVQYAYSTQA